MKKASDKLKNNYIVVQSWMVRELGLKGNRLVVYAIIHGFSQTEKQVCTCGIEYMRAWTNSSKQGILNMLDSLVTDGLIERLENFDGDKRKTAYRAIGQQSLPKSGKIGKESLPKIGQQSLPKKPKNRSTLFRASLENNNNNFQTDKSVCQSTRACAREDETDGQTEKEFYAECVFANWKKLKSELWGEENMESGCEYDKRLGDVVKELLRRETVTVNGVELTATDMLKTVNELFADASPETLLSALVSGCAPEIKKKFNYTVTALYNAAKQF